MKRRFAELPSQARIKELLRYDPNTGLFTWAQSRGPNIAGTQAGWVHKTGYIYIGIDGKAYKAHRVAWVFVHGDAPQGLLDHVDRNPQNNRIANLREVSEHQSNQNKRLYKNNRAGVKGIGWQANARKWRVRIQANGHVHHLGTYETFDAAVKAREAGEQRLHTLQKGGLPKTQMTL